MMCVVHDLAEAQGKRPLVPARFASQPPSVDTVGDITPREGIPKDEKRRLEEVGPFRRPCIVSPSRTRLQEAMHNFVHDMLHASPAALRIEALWEVRPRHIPDTT